MVSFHVALRRHMETSYHADALGVDRAGDSFPSTVAGGKWGCASLTTGRSRLEPTRTPLGERKFRKRYAVIRSGVLCCALITSWTAAKDAALGYRDGPPLAHTGGFGEPTCLECHFDLPVNDPATHLLVTGVPDAYEPGQRYPIRLTLHRAGLGSGGFQLAVRYSEPAELAGKQAGTLRSSNAHVQVLPDSGTGVSYAQHTGIGTRPTQDTVSWTVEWTAPTGPRGIVVLHLTANAANDDASEFGDYILVRRLFSARRD